MFQEGDEILIIGAGAFGLSTAMAMAQRHPELGKIHVVDRYEPPVPDGSSTDTTRCLRFDYPKKIYADLSKKGMEIIENDGEISPLFHKVGMTFVYDGNDDKWGKIWKNQLAEVKNLNGPDGVVMQDSPEEVFKRIHGHNPPSGHKTRWRKAYTNPQSGWIEAENAMKAYYEKCKKYKKIVFTFQEVEKIVYTSGTNKAEGVKFTSGAFLPVKLVIVAAGAWSCKLVDMEPVSKSSCIEVGWIKVTPDEAQQWKNMSITTNLSTGINTFPPYNGEIKVLRRSAGFVNTVKISHPSPAKSGEQVISYPRTSMTNPDDWIPKEAEDILRENLKEILPPLSNRPFDRTKVCWLTQTKSANFLVDYHPELEGVMMVTGGSAHGWKFVPVIGDKVVDYLEGKLSAELQDLWSWNEKLRATVDSGSAPRMDGVAPEMSTVMRKNPLHKPSKI